MPQHLYVQRWRLNEDRIIKVGAFFFAIILWPIFAAIELMRRMLTVFDRRRT